MGTSWLRRGVGRRRNGNVKQGALVEFADRRTIVQESTKMQARSLQNRQQIDLGSSWATKAVSETRPDTLGTFIGQPNGTPRPILGHPRRAKSGHEPSERFSEPCQRRSKTLSESCPRARDDPSVIERSFGSISGWVCPVARKLRCAKNVAPANVWYTSDELSTERAGASKKLENRGVSVPQNRG